MTGKTLCLTGALLLAAGAAPAMAFPELPEALAGEGGVVSAENALYEKGTRALDDGDWNRAAEAFTEVTKMGGSRADAALYWVAYALNRQGRRADALAILQRFAGTYPKSSWLKDARALEREIRRAGGHGVAPEQETDEDLKLMAINSLVNTDSERALPLLEKFLQGQHSEHLKERALFVLAQSESPRAREIVAGIARGKSNPELQDKAIKYLGLFGGQKSRGVLAEIYSSTTSLEARERILKSFMVAGDKDRILTAAKTEKAPELRAAAARLLGVMGGRADLWQLYQSEPSREVKDAILQGMFVAGDADHIVALARDEKEPDLRRRAIQKLGIMGREQTGDLLVSLYRTERDPDARRAVLNGLFVQNNAHALVEIARNEKDRQWKEEAVKKLSIMHDREATEYLLGILKE